MTSLLSRLKRTKGIVEQIVEAFTTIDRDIAMAATKHKGFTWKEEKYNCRLENPWSDFDLVYYSKTRDRYIFPLSEPLDLDYVFQQIIQLPSSGRADFYKAHRCFIGGPVISFGYQGVIHEENSLKKFADGGYYLVMVHPPESQAHIFRGTFAGEKYSFPMSDTDGCEWVDPSSPLRVRAGEVAQTLQSLRQQLPDISDVLAP